MNICVIGGGAAGISAASMAKRTNPDATVVCCTEYEDVAYSPCGIPYVLGPRDPGLRAALPRRARELRRRRHRPAHRDGRVRGRPERAHDDGERRRPPLGPPGRLHRLELHAARRAGERPRGAHLRQEHPPRDGAERDPERRPQGRGARGRPAGRRDGDRARAPRHRDPRRRRERLAARPGRRRRHRRAGAGEPRGARVHPALRHRPPGLRGERREAARPSRPARARSRPTSA